MLKYKEKQAVANKEESIADFDKIITDKGRTSNPIYKAYGYPSKVYYKNIEKYIYHYTREGDIVLDSCAGSGSTGIAAVATNRNAILIDSSPQAVNISKNILSKFNLQSLENTFQRIIDDIGSTIDKLYEIVEDGKVIGFADTIYRSNIYECPDCHHEIVLYNNSTGKRSEYKCINCGFTINISKVEHKSLKVENRRAIEYKGRNNKGKSIRAAVTSEIINHWNAIAAEYESKYGSLWAPDEKIIYNRCYPRKGGWPGFSIDSSVTDLFTKRNVLALKILYNYISNIPVEQTVKDYLIFVFTESLFRSSNRLFTESGIKTVYHIPPVGKVQNVLTVFIRKYKSLLKAKKYYIEEVVKNKESFIEIKKGNAKELDLESDSVDYAFIDPPYGGIVPYAELNLFYSAWLGEKEDLDNEIIIPMDYDKDETYVKQWGEMIELAFEEVFRVLKPGAYFTIVFHSKFNSIWNELREIMNKRIGFEFINIVGADRSTTFHTNNMNDTNPINAFITYRKPSEILEANTKSSVNDFFNTLDKNKVYSFRELQSILILEAHRVNIEKIPSDKELLNLIKEYSVKIKE